MLTAAEFDQYIVPSIGCNVRYTLPIEDGKKETFQFTLARAYRLETIGLLVLRKDDGPALLIVLSFEEASLVIEWIQGELIFGWPDGRGGDYSFVITQPSLVA